MQEKGYSFLRENLFEDKFESKGHRCSAGKDSAFLPAKLSHCQQLSKITVSLKEVLSPSSLVAKSQVSSFLRENFLRVNLRIRAKSGLPGETLASLPAKLWHPQLLVVVSLSLLDSTKFWPGG